MRAHYFAYPELDRRIRDRRLPRVCAPGKLRAWYLARLSLAAGDPGLYSQLQWVRTLVALTGVTRQSAYRLLNEPMLWDRGSNGWQPRSPEWLHAQLGLTLRYLKSASHPLRESPDAWAIQGTIDAIREEQVDAEQLTPPLRQADIAARVGITDRTVRNHLSRSTQVEAVHQFLAVPRNTELVTDTGLRKLKDGPHEVLYRQLPSRYRIREAPPFRAWRRNSYFGALLRKKRFTKLPDPAPRSSKPRELWVKKPDFPKWRVKTTGEILPFFQSLQVPLNERQEVDREGRDYVWVEPELGPLRLPTGRMPYLPGGRSPTPTYGRYP